jgi:anti-sigma regulatory factor (Ser/Thr protein kinase)
MLLVHHDPASAAIVRREIAADLEARSITRDSVADVILVASELVGNAVVHCTGAEDLDVAWDLQGDDVIVRVNDGSDDQPTPRTADQSATSGRGLAIVAAIAAEWGVQRAAHGKQVWARIPICHMI